MDNIEDKELQSILDRCWYQSFCTEKEIDRILNPRNAQDFLLKKRADIVADNPRYCRVYLKLSQLPSYQSFEETFSVNHYHEFVSCLNEEDRRICNAITYGDVFYKDFNGYAAKEEPWGDLIYINQCLKMFCNFINLALLDFKQEVPLNIRRNAMRIAIRISMETESMDFFLDPRGQVSENIFKELNDIGQLELQYIAGHEFCHFLCGHFQNGQTLKSEIYSYWDKKYYDDIYTPSQQQELEADLNSITRPKYNKNQFNKLVRAALIWFISLDIVEFAREFYSPCSHLTIKSHPNAMQRYNYILKNVGKIKASTLKEMEKITKRAETLKDFLKDDLTYNFDNYEMYGSAYLDKPNTKWRGRELIDRKDF